MPNNNGTQNATNAGGMGFAGWLTLLFIALKLMGYITWSWWWVLSPIWITLLIVAVILIGAFVYYLIAG